jgi:hypothetical protein
VYINPSLEYIFLISSETLKSPTKQLRSLRGYEASSASFA